MKNRIAVRLGSLAPLALLAALFLLTALGAAPALAQSTSPVDGITPLGLSPGRPAGSFPLSGFETVNLFNGNLNFALPLLRVEGRGEAGFTMQLTIERRWSLRLANPRKRPGEPDLYALEWDWGPKPGYSPGTMYRRTATQRVSRDEDRLYVKYQEALTRFTFRRGDGTEHDFRDDLLDGEARGWYEGQAPTFRGARWHSTDGTAATFVSDLDIRDPGDSPGGTTPAGGGRLLLADGTEYRIGDGAGGVPGRVTRIRDRNGNTVRLDYADGELTRATDSLGRATTIEYRRSPDAQEDEIRYGGYGGAVRTILVRRQRMRECLAEGETTRTYAELFPSLDMADPSVFDPVVPCAVELPNGTSYDFAYNAYGELARVTLPTGGRFEYEWGSGVDDNAFGLLSLGSGGDGRVWSWAVLRRVRSRKVYNYDQLEQWTEYDAAACQLGDCRVDVRHLDPEGQLVRLERHSFDGNPRASFFLEPCDYPAWTDGRETGVEVFDGADNRLRRVANTWAQRAPLPWNTGPTLVLGQPPNDVRLTRATTTLEDGRSSSVRYEHDDYNNVTLQEESDFGGGVVRTTTRGFVAGAYAAEPAHLRSLPAWEDVAGRGEAVSRTVFEYDQYGDAEHGPLVERPGITGWVDVGRPERGNLTSVRRWLDRPGRGSAAAEAVVRRAYDVAGNLVREKDPEGHATTYGWDDNYGRPDANLSDGGDRGTFARPTLVRNALGHETRTQFDFETGRPVDQRDPNGVLTLLEYGDPLDRLTRVVHAADVAHEPFRAQTSFTYTDGRWRREVLTHQDQDAFDDGARKTRVRYDELGREWQTARKPPHPAPWIAVDKRYDERGRLSLVSSPYEEEADVSQDWTVTRYDALDRPVSVTTPDGAVVRTSYAGPEVTVTDAASRSRTSETDALGRVVAVTEYPDGESPWWTAYTYDPLDRLVGVKQGPQPARSFVYDSLGRLREATNPESGLVRYDYDLGGALTWRRDARGVETTYVSDPLGRVTRRSYSDGTPAVSFTWDRDPSGRLPTSLGRLLAVDNGVSTTEYVHDAVGRVEASTQRTGGREFTFAYTRDLAGNVVEERYPSGRIVTTAIDKLDRVTLVKDAGLTRASAFEYTPHGAPRSVLLGNGLTETTAFNVRLQPERIALGAPGRPVLSIDYRYWPRDGRPQSNNGNVWGQTITVPARHPLLPPTVLDQTYAYDGLNRLAWAREGGGWAQQYRYDRWGNRVVAGDVPQPALSADSLEAHVDPQTNRLMLGHSGYDAAGNQTADPLGRAIEYDAENRQTAFAAGALADGQVLSTLYAYDGDGRRVSSIGPSGRTLFVYDALGRLAAEYSDDTTPMGGAHYLTTDALGSVRVVTDDAARVVSRHDYLPFGEEIPATSGPRADLADYRGADLFRHRFTGKERDRESGLDYFGARYFSGAQGRFMIPDAPFADQHRSSPQSWNLYAYVRNNPLAFIDDTGRGAKRAIIGKLAAATERRAFDSARAAGVREAWRLERRLVEATGRGTVEWSDMQKAELLSVGRVRGYEGHHINNVAAHDLAMARDARNIAFKKGRGEHLDTHGGNWRGGTTGELVDRQAMLDSAEGGTGASSKVGGLLSLLLSLVMPAIQYFEAAEAVVEVTGEKVDEFNEGVRDGHGTLGRWRAAQEEAYPQHLQTGLCAAEYSVCPR